MSLRISLILAILAGLGASGLAYYQRTIQIPALIQQRNAQKNEKQRTIAANDQAKVELKTTKVDLSLRSQELAAVKVAQKNALARSDTQEKRADVLQGQLASSNNDFQVAKIALSAYQASGLTSDEAVSLSRNLNAAEGEVAELNSKHDQVWRDLALTRNRLALYVPLIDEPTISYSLKGTIVSVDPKWNFVVLDVGENQGAVQNGELLVSRKSQLVGKVIITAVQKDRCIANIIPGWNMGKIAEGDVVTPAHPASSLSIGY